MNVWFRVLYVWLRARFGARLDMPFGTSLLNLMVLPNDLDTNLHMNNGRYLTLMDLGRLDCFIRSGLLSALRGTGWIPVLSAAKVRFRREMRLWRRFRLETRIVYWVDTSFVMEHRCIIAGRNGEDVVAAIALMRGGIYDRKGRRFVMVERLFDMVGLSHMQPEASAEVQAFLDAEDALKRSV